MSNRSVYDRLKNRLKGSGSKSSGSKPCTVLLLTNRNSDNVGDHAIEACDISLIKAAMKNLGISENAYRITSRDASIIPRSYAEKKDPKQLERARKLISDADVVMFGGAPLINYRYQVFYERTAATIDLAQELDTPVFLSSIGVESYDEDDPRCQRIKTALNQECVKRISTRDGFDLLEKYRDRESLPIDKASDPAVFAKWVFRDIAHRKAEGEKKKIGIFVIRHNAFEDNGLDFTWKQAADMWCGLAKELEKRGYDYEFLTSGHYADEVMLYGLDSNYGIPSSRCVTTVNYLEDLIGHLSEYDAIVTCRLHPSILAYSMGIPSVSLLWNPKVRGFYDSTGYSDRIIELMDFDAETIADRAEAALKQGVRNDEEYYMSVYRNIFSGLRDSLENADRSAEMYSFDELVSAMPPYEGTSEEEKNIRLRRKFRRIYNNFDQLLRSI